MVWSLSNHSMTHLDGRGRMTDFDAHPNNKKNICYFFNQSAWQPIGPLNALPNNQPPGLYPGRA